MKIAVACVNGQVFQHFGHCPSFLICNIENKEIISSEMLDTTGHGCGMLAGFLKSHDVDVVICGGIGGGAKKHIIEAGMELLPGASGDALMQVENYLEGTLSFDPDTECDHHKHDENHQCGHNHKCH